MREYLPCGTIISLHGRDYRIEAVIGEGASCIVYAASAENGFGSIRKYRLKECYPHDTSCGRNGSRLVWNDATQQTAAFSRFRKSIAVISQLRDDASLGNYFTELEPYEANGTLYAVMSVNHAKTYDKDRSTDLCRILQTILKLTRIVEKLHNHGYLHLDIKPENFLVEYDPEPNIWLFDVDSLVPVSDFRNGRTFCYSYSREWAAPELAQGKRNLICPATDIYAIGAILFHKVMGRPVSNDDIGLFAEWEFDSWMFDNVNPKVQRYLDEIFRKTLSAAVKCRYQTAGELASDLELALGVMGKPYLLSNVPDNSQGFIGREQEISEIRKAFQDNKHIVFLTGFGGIGKSELAKRFGNLQQKDYDAVIYAVFADSVESSLLDIEIQDFDGSEKQQLKQLNRLLGSNVLLIIDNMDAEDAPGLDRLSRLKCDILITSRLQWQEYGFPTINIGSLSQEEQLSLFLYECGGIMNISQRQAVFRILSAIEGYTLLIPLIARQVRKGDISIEEIADNVQVAGIKGASIGRARLLKDGTALSGTVYSILSAVLNMANFTEPEKYVMRCLALLSKYRIRRSEFLRWIGKEYTEQIDNLTFEAWIQCAQYRGNMELSLHAVISEMCFEELKPSMTNCKGIRNRLLQFSADFATWHKNPTSFYCGGYVPTHIKANLQYQYDAYVQLMQSILPGCDWADPDNIVFWLTTIEAITNVIYGDFRVFEYFLAYAVDINQCALEHLGTPLPRISYAFVAMMAISLQHDKLEDALLLAYHVVDTIQSVRDPVETIFRMCIHFYQWVCLRRLDFVDYWNTPGFDDLAGFIRDQWNAVIEEEVIRFEESSVCVLHNGNSDSYGICVDKAIAQAFEDFCYKISPEGISEAKDPFPDISVDASDITDIASKAVEYASKLCGIDAQDRTVPNHENYLTVEEAELSKLVRIKQEHVNELLGCNVANPMGIWIVMNPKSWSEAEKEEMHIKLLQIDTMLPVHIPSIAGRSTFAYDLAKMEAAFSYAYAVAEDWEKYSFHKGNLLEYYKFHIDGKDLFTCSISDIKSGLPGLASLLNLHGNVLPATLALELLSDVIKLMEKHHASKHIPVDNLFEIYEMALTLAENANDTAKILHFQQRVNHLSSVYFNPKE